MRAEVTSLLDRDLPKARPAALVEALERSLRDDEVLQAVAVGTMTGIRGSMLVAVTGERVLLVPAGQAEREFAFADLACAVTLPGGKPGEALFVPLKQGELFDAITMSAVHAERLAEVTRQSLIAQKEPAAQLDWWRDPTFSATVRLWPVGLLVAPQGTLIPNKTWVTVSVVPTGVQVRTGATPSQTPPKRDLRFFLSWSRVEGLAVEGIDQVTQRPRVLAVVAFGVLGLAARKTEKRAYMTLSALDGDYVFEVHQMLPSELRGTLAPFLTKLAASRDAESSAVTGDGEDPIEQIRRLGELRDAGYVTPEEFESTKAALLRDLINPG